MATRGFLKELGKEHANSILHCDSQSAIHLAQMLIFYSRTMHIQLRFRFKQSLLHDGVLSLEKISGSQNPVDMLTKAVTIDKMKLCATSNGLQA